MITHRKSTAKQKVIDFLEGWKKDLDRDGLNMGDSIMYRIEDGHPGPDPDADLKNCFTLYADSFLYEIIEYYRSDGMHAWLGKQWERFLQGLSQHGWIEEPYNCGVYVFYND